MSRPRDIAEKATAESRAKGGRAKAEKIRADKEEARRLYLEHLAGLTSPALRLSALVDSEDERVAIRAVVEILDRLFERPTQQLAGDESREPIEVRLAFDPRGPA